MVIADCPTLHTANHNTITHASYHFYTITNISLGNRLPIYNTTHLSTAITPHYPDLYL